MTQLAISCAAWSSPSRLYDAYALSHRYVCAYFPSTTPPKKKSPKQSRQAWLRDTPMNYKYSLMISHHVSRCFCGAYRSSILGAFFITTLLFYKLSHEYLRFPSSGCVVLFPFSSTSDGICICTTISEVEVAYIYHAEEFNCKYFVGRKKKLDRAVYCRGVC